MFTLSYQLSAQQKTSHAVQPWNNRGSDVIKCVCLQRAGRLGRTTLWQSATENRAFREMSPGLYGSPTLTHKDYDQWRVLINHNNVTSPSTPLSLNLWPTRHRVLFKSWLHVRYMCAYMSKKKRMHNDHKHQVHHKSASILPLKSVLIGWALLLWTDEQRGRARRGALQR